MSRAQESSQLIILSLRENGRCVPCIIYPKLVNWDTTITPGSSPSSDQDVPSIDSESETSNSESAWSTTASDFEPSGLGHTPFVPQHDFLNSDFTDFPPSDHDDESDEDL